MPVEPHHSGRSRRAGGHSPRDLSPYPRAAAPSRVVLAYPRTYVLLYRRGFRASHRVAVDTGTSTQVHTFTLYLCTWKVYLPLTSARGTRYTTRVRGTRLRVRLTRYAIPFARGASAAYQECSDLSSADSPFAHKGSMVGKRLAVEARSGLRGEWGRGAVPCPERVDRKVVSSQAERRRGVGPGA